MGPDEVLRQERKFDLNLTEAAGCEQALRHYMRPDPHNGSQGYLVRSLYFDTYLNRDFWDKSGGYPQRKKLRLRSYSPRDGFALLEMKQKDGAQQRKRSLRVSREEAEQLIQGRYSLLLDLDDPFAAECHSLLETLFYRPKVLIEYRRTAYLLPTNSIRITFDREIRAQTGHLDLFADPFLGAPVFPGFHTILEVKYNHFLPSYIRDALRYVDASECSASKYGMSRAGSAFHSV